MKLPSPNTAKNPLQTVKSTPLVLWFSIIISRAMHLLGKPNMIASTSVHCGSGQYPSLKDNLFSVCYSITINLMSRTQRENQQLCFLEEDGFACRFLLECETASPNTAKNPLQTVKSTPLVLWFSIINSRAVHLLDLLEDITIKVKSLYFNHVMEEAATAKIAPKSSRLNPLNFR